MTKSERVAGHIPPFLSPGTIHIMTSSIVSKKNPDEVIELQDCEAALYVGLLCPDGSQADCMEVKDRLGIGKRVLIVARNGVRTVTPLLHAVQISSSSLTAPTIDKWGNEPSLIPVPEAQSRKFLAIYDRFTKRTY